MPVLTSDVSRDWWRPDAPAMSTSAHVPDVDMAFKALVAFTIILLVAPQEWFPVLKSLRIALAAATVSLVAYMFDGAVKRRPVSTFTTEMGMTSVSRSQRKPSAGSSPFASGFRRMLKIERTAVSESPGR